MMPDVLVMHPSVTSTLELPLFLSPSTHYEGPSSLDSWVVEGVGGHLGLGLVSEKPSHPLKSTLASFSPHVPL